VLGLGPHRRFSIPHQQPTGQSLTISSLPAPRRRFKSFFCGAQIIVSGWQSNGLWSFRRQRLVRLTFGQIHSRIRNNFDQIAAC